MATSALAHDALLPRSGERVGLGAALALLAHAGLVGALALGLNWRLPITEPVVSAELWSAVPQVAAPAPAPAPAPAEPPAPAPTPAPAARAEPPAPPAPDRSAERAAARAAEQAAAREAEIALEKAAQRQKAQQAQDEARAAKAAKDAKEAKDAAERQRADERQRKAQAEAQRLKQKLEDQRLADEQAAQRKKAQQAKDEKAREDKRLKDLAAQREAAEKAQEAKAQEALVAKQREENLKRMLGQAGATGSGAANSAGTAARDAAPSASYAGRIKAFIKPNIKFPGDLEGRPVAEIEVRCAPDGSIVSRRVAKPSGNKAWDDAVLRAVDLTRKLPLDTDGRIPAAMVLVFDARE